MRSVRQTDTDETEWLDNDKQWRRLHGARGHVPLPTFTNGWAQGAP